jgi:RND family efflux transporter MFP subunit
MKKLVILMTGLLILLIFAACGNNEQEFRNIEQIQQSEGIPVKVEKISLQPFVISVNYNANLYGIKETTLTSMIADRIEEVHVRVGDYVEEDDLLLSFPEDNPSAQFIQAKAAYNNIVQTYERMSALFAEGGISQQELDQLKTSRQVAEANLKASEKMIMIRAPYSGTVTHLNFRAAESAGPGDPLLTIARINKYQTQIWVTENDINQIKPGLKAIARWQNYELPGKVTQVARSIDKNRQAFAVDLEFDNPQNFLLTGVMAAIELFRYDNPQAIVIPRQFIFSDSEGDFVFLAEGERALTRYIETGENDGMNFEIVAGLSVGDPLIKEGANLISVNTRIRIIN